jgi:glycosyltransferase involved in cell wall biosynthesis
MTSSPWHIAVLIPARDEEQLLPRCLRSVQLARLRLPAFVTSDVVVASDCSRDRTQQIAEEMLGESGAVVRSDAGLVGAARSLAAEMALGRYHGAPEHCWLANTDADCEVPETWLLDQLTIAASGYAAVAGIIDIDSFEEHGPQVPELFRLTYLIKPDGTHPHVHGANLGIRADAYLRAGGWSDLATAEDHDLWARLHYSGQPRLSDARLRVITSGRRSARAPMGFAQALAAHNSTPLRDS